MAYTVVGANGESWTNQYAEVTSQAGDIVWIVFEAISPADARDRFCMDDMTIVPVAEPTSLAALATGLLPIALAMRKRRD